MTESENVWEHNEPNHRIKQRRGTLFIVSTNSSSWKHISSEMWKAEEKDEEHFEAEYLDSDNLL